MGPIRFLLVAIGLALAAPVATAQTMSFAFESGDDACTACRRIVATGVIEADTAQNLTTFIRSHDVHPRDVVVLTSPGGSLLGGIELGKAIRIAGLSTHVGSLRPRPDASDRHECASACAYAFLGGLNRSMASDGRLGLHRFAPATDRTVSARATIETTQVILSDLFEYLEEMGVANDYAVAATATASEDISWPPYQTLVVMRAINSSAPYSSPSWARLSGVANVLALEAVRADGSMDRFMLECSIGFHGRPAKMIYAHDSALDQSATSRTTFAVAVSIQPSISGVPALIATSEFPSGLSFYRNGNGFSISFQLNPDRLLAIAASDAKATLRFAGDERFATAFGSSDVVLPLQNLATLMRSELNLCRS